MFDTPALHALLIGAGQYESPGLKPAPLAVNDVLEFREFLRSRAGLHDDCCRLLTSPLAYGAVPSRKADWLDGLDALTRAPLRETDSVVIYYSGQALASGDETYFLPMDARPSSPQLLGETAVGLKTLLAYLRQVHAGQQLVILDAWRGELAAALAATGEAVWSGSLSRVVIEQLQRAAAADQDINRTFLLCCSDGQVSCDYPQGRHSWFCHHLMASLRENAGGWVDLGQPFATRLAERMWQAATTDLHEAATQRPLLIGPGRPFRLRVAPLPTTTPEPGIPVVSAASTAGGAPGGKGAAGTAAGAEQAGDLPPVPHDICELESLIEELEQAIGLSASPAKDSQPGGQSAPADLSRRQGLERQLAKLKTLLLARQQEDFSAVLRGFFSRCGAASEFPFEAWLEFEAKLRARRYSWPLLETIGRAEAVFAEWREESAWLAAKQGMSLNAFRKYLAEWPQGRFVAEARHLIQPLLATLWQSWLGAGQPWENSLGMRFMPVPGTSVFFCVWPARVRDYRVYSEQAGRPWQAPHFRQGPTHPAVNVSWEDALAFCEWLTDRERANGLLGLKQHYRLPTDEEWSAAVGLTTEVGATPAERSLHLNRTYPWGEGWPPPPDAGNYSPALKVDQYDYTSPVGSFSANEYGLYDLGGNAWEWCEDWYDAEHTFRTLRGASWVDATPGSLRSAHRHGSLPQTRNFNHGFRIVLAFLPAIPAGGAPL